MFNAMRHRRPSDIEDAIRRAFPQMSLVAAKRLVLTWWKVDHPAEEAPRPHPSPKRMETA